MFVPHPTHFLPPRGQKARLLALAFLFLAPFAFGLLALALGQDANWDLRNYHWYNAWAFLNQRYDIDLLPSQTPYFYNPLLDVPFFLLATHVSAKAASFVLGFVQGLNFIFLFMIAHAVLLVPNQRHKVLAAAGLATIGMLGGGGIAQIGTTFWDNVTSLGVFLSAALVIRHMDRLMTVGAAKAFWLAMLFGIPVGLMMGLKLPSVVYAVGLCGGLLFIGKWPRALMLSFAFGIGVLIGCGITFGWWGYFLTTNFGSPIFPYFNNVFQSPYAPLDSSRDLAYVPHSIDEYFTMPFLIAHSSYRVGEIEWRDWRLPILYALLPVALAARMLWGRNRAAPDLIARPYPARYLLASFGIAYVVWLVLFSIYRYAVPIEMITPLLIVFVVGMLPLRIGTRGLLTGLILFVIACSVQAGNWHRRPVWLDRFVEAEIPPLPDTSNLMILMAGIEPYSHLIPQFPPEIAWVRIQSNFSSPEQDKGINALIHERVDAHRKANGKFMVMVPQWQVKTAQGALSYFGLKVLPNRCLTVTDRLFDDMPMSLCAVVSKERALP